MLRVCVRVMYVLMCLFECCVYSSENVWEEGGWQVIPRSVVTPDDVIETHTYTHTVNGCF